MDSIELKVLAPVYGGMFLSQSAGVIFVKGAITDETVVVKIKERKKDYSIAETIEVVDASPDRREPLCPVFNVCGGCHYQYINYQRQLEIKKEVLKDCLNRIGHLDIAISEPLAGMEWGYRTKVQLKISHDGLLGFYREGSRDVTPIKDCPIAAVPINRVITKISDITGNLKGSKTRLNEIHVLSGINLIALLKGDNISEAFIRQFIDIGFDGVSIDGVKAETEYCSFETGLGYRYTVSPNSFYQTNWELNQILIEKVLKEAVNAKYIVDVYGGAGNFAIPLSKGLSPSDKNASNVLIIEENPYSKGDALRNIKINKAKNIKYMSKSFEKVKLDRRVDLMILNPPRRGLTTAAINVVKGNLPDKIIYISCNPSTFARDILKLSDVYRVSSVDLVDMFPNTYHCEAMGILEMK